MENKFAENLSKLRKLHRLSQAELAEQIDAAEIAVDRYEEGLREPRVHRLIKLAEIFGVTLDELVYGDFESLANSQKIRRKLYDAILCLTDDQAQALAELVAFRLKLSE